MVVVGEPSAGKTTLIRLLTNEGVSKRDCYKEFVGEGWKRLFFEIELNSFIFQNRNTATPGIDITNNERPEDGFSLHFYVLFSSFPPPFFLSYLPSPFQDFGGQETLFPTHQLFLTHDTLYLITVNLSNYDKKYLFYWGEVITRQVWTPLLGREGKYLFILLN